MADLAGRGHRGDRGLLRPPRGDDRRAVGQQYAQCRAGVAPHPDYEIVAQRQEILRPAPAHEIRHHHHARKSRGRRSDPLSGLGTAGRRPRDGRGARESRGAGGRRIGQLAQEVEPA